MHVPDVGNHHQAIENGVGCVLVFPEPYLQRLRYVPQTQKKDFERTEWLSRMNQ